MVETKLQKLLIELEEMLSKHQKLFSELEAGRTGKNEKCLSDTYVPSPEPNVPRNIVTPSKRYEKIEELGQENQSTEFAPPVFQAASKTIEENKPAVPSLNDSAKILNVSRGKIINKSRRIIFNFIFFTFLFIVAMAAVINLTEKRNIFGYSIANVLTGSMQQEIPKNSLIWIKQIDPNMLQIGDDVTYLKNENISASHRIIGIVENFNNTGTRGFETKGTSNNHSDPEIIPAAKVAGKVVGYVPFVGGGLAWIGDHYILSFIFAVGIIVIALILFGRFKRRPPKKIASNSKIGKQNSAISRPSGPILQR